MRMGLTGSCCEGGLLGRLIETSCVFVRKDKSDQFEEDDNQPHADGEMVVGTLNAAPD
jgi:hypothetical protein